MKKGLNVIVKAALAMMLVMCAYFANAQSAAWTTSKDVQKVANIKMFEDENLKKSHIHATAVSPTWMIAKGVHRSNDDQNVKGNIASKGYPTWMISKGVQRVGRK
jgi:hypothetical protein